VAGELRLGEPLELEAHVVRAVTRLHLRSGVRSRVGRGGVTRPGGAVSLFCPAATRGEDERQNGQETQQAPVIASHRSLPGSSLPLSDHRVPPQSAARNETCHGMTSRSLTRTTRYRPMPRTAETSMAAQASGDWKSGARLPVYWPSTFWGPPKYSAMIAPMSDSGTATFIAVKKYGRALGMRTRRRTVYGEAAIARINSNSEGSTSASPRAVFAMTGKNTITPTTAIFETGFVDPKSWVKMGAVATIGMALPAAANGIAPKRRVVQRATAAAAPTPRIVPITSPPSASPRVRRP